MNHYRNYLKFRQIKFTLIASLIVLAVSAPFANAQPQTDYLNEFSEGGERSGLLSSWEYVTQDGAHRTIAIFEYCALSCVLIPFDVENHALLNDQQTLRFFENLALQQMLVNAAITEGTYSDIPLGKGSVVCNFTAPRLDIEVKALTLQVLATDVLPRMLPKNAGRIVETIYDAGETVGIVKSTSVPILLLGASCVAGDYLENLATSALVTCALLIQNVRNNRAYEGQFEDLMNCHSEALARLNLARYSPDLLTQHVETQAQNWLMQLASAISNWFCQFSGCKTTQPTTVQSNYDKALTELSVIQDLNQTYIRVAPKAQDLFNAYRFRIALKVQETNKALSDLNSEISRLNSRLSGYTALNGLYTSVLNLVKTPGYDFSAAVANQTLASQFYHNAESLNSTYVFNSAIRTANTGITYAANGMNAVTQEEAIPQEQYFSTALIAILAVTVIAAFSVIVACSRQSNYF